MLSLAQTECRLVHWHLLSGPHLGQKFDVIIAANASSVCYTSRLKLCVPDIRWCTGDTQPCSALLQSWAQCSSPPSRDGQMWTHYLDLSPEFFTGVNGLHENLFFHFSKHCLFVYVIIRHKRTAFMCCCHKSMMMDKIQVWRKGWKVTLYSKYKIMPKKNS